MNEKEVVYWLANLRKENGISIEEVSNVSGLKSRTIYSFIFKFFKFCVYKCDKWYIIVNVNNIKRRMNYYEM